MCDCVFLFSMDWKEMCELGLRICLFTFFRLEGNVRIFAKVGGGDDRAR